MYLFKIQGKLEHFPGSLQYDIVNSILLYIRQTVLKARVEDAQLGVESYQRRLNFKEPRMQIEGMFNMRPFTIVRRPFGVVYAKIPDTRRFMDYNEVHKFGDQTLKFVSIQLKEKLKCHREGENVG